MKKIICLCFVLLLLGLSACTTGNHPAASQSENNLESENASQNAVASSESVSTPTIADYVPMSTEENSEGKEVEPTTNAIPEDVIPFSDNHAAGDCVSFSIYKIEPLYTVTKTSSSDIPTISMPTDREQNYICKCYINLEHTEFLYLYISGNDYCDNFTGSDAVASLTYFLPPKVAAEAVYSDSLADDFAETSDTLLSYQFVGIVEKQSYDESKAVSFQDSCADGTLVFIQDIYSIEPISYAYHQKDAGSYLMTLDYELEYIICVCRMLNSEKTYQLALTIDEYNTIINPNANLEFNGNSFVIGSRVTGNFETVFFNTPITIYGFARSTDMIISESEYPTTIIFHHVAE